MRLLVIFLIAFFIAAVPASAFIKIIQKELGEGRSRRKGGGGGGGAHEPEDFQGVFTRSMRKLQRQVLRRHNYYRRRHGCQLLREDEDMNRYAQAWALELAKKGRMQHRTRPKYGENLFMSWSSDMNKPIHGKQAVDSWYNEIKDYDYGRPGFSSKTGHFTQVVWKKSKYLGTGVARGRKGAVFIVSVYDPRGNFMGRFPQNVPRPMDGGGQQQQELA
ncbi:Golgi-associated plant pathogenesis-related protein 1-like [Amblyomma americanum]|uniref:SCP domain-containing protein n=1 Tax=Amblyomma americanum TaxID=6943 RepID=A0AAQ4DMD1_AMBAM